MKLLIYGTGFIDSALARQLGGVHGSGVHEITLGRSRLEQASELLAEINRSDVDWVCFAPTHVGRSAPVLIIVIGVYNLAAACASAGRRLAHISSGCLY